MSRSAFRPLRTARTGLGLGVRAAAGALLPAALIGALALSGCGAAPVARPPEPTANPTAGGAAPSIPSDGRTLAVLGFDNGPIQSFTLPQTAAISTASDQPSLVTVVLVSPDAASMYAYLVRALPATGYAISGQHDDARTPALSFSGHGWTGAFTGDDATSAITLRPEA